MSSSRPSVAVAIIGCVALVALGVSSGCTRAGSETDPHGAETSVSASSTTEPVNPQTSPSDHLSGDDPVLVARRQLAQDSELALDGLVGEITASAVDGRQVWVRVAVTFPGVPGFETEQVYLMSEDEGPWQVVTYGTGVEMGDLGVYGASPATERGLFYWVSANETVYDLLADAEDGRYSTLKVVRQRFLNLQEDGFWALVDLAEYPNKEPIELMVTLEWDLETGDWAVVDYGETAYSVSAEVPEQLMGGPWTNDITY